MSSLQNMIEEALAHASPAAKTASAEAEKVAAAPTASEELIKTAHDVAGALEYAAHAVLNETPQGDEAHNLLRQFFKEAAKGGPAVSSAPEGTQAVPPTKGKTKLNTVPSPTGDPKVTPAMNGKQDPNILRTMPGKTASLFDMLTLASTDTDEGENKEAMRGPNDPQVSDAEVDAAAPKASRTSGLRKLLSSNTAPSAATKRQAKAPTRADIAEVFPIGAGDPTGQAAASAAWSSGVASMKVAALKLAMAPNAAGVALNLRKAGKAAASLSMKKKVIGGALAAGAGVLGAGAAAKKMSEKKADGLTRKERNRGVQRATSRELSGGSKYLSDKDLVKSRLKNTAGGMLSGAALGGLYAASIAGGSRSRKAMLGAALGGGIGGAVTGGVAGDMRATENFLKKRGISSVGGLRPRFNADAKKKYTKSEKKASLTEVLTELKGA